MKKAILVALAILLALLMALWPADAKALSIKGSEQQKTQDTYKVSAFTELMVQGQIEIEFNQSPDDAYTVAYNGPYNLTERSAQIKVRVSDTLNAQAQGRGVVQYKGWPQVINKTGKGTVKQDK